MMQDLKIVCPSKGRAGNVRTKKFVPSITMIVPASEEAQYKLHNPELEVIATPPHIKGITPTRQWILENFTNVFMLDDDITAVRRNYAAPGDDPMVTDQDEILEIILKTAQIAKDLKAYLFGFSKIRNPLEFNSFKPYMHTGFVNNSFFGVLEGHELAYDTTMEEGEDHYISCLAVYKHRYLFINNFYSFITDGNFTAIGGCNGYRNTEVMLKNTMKLRQYFGEVIQFKGATKLKSKVHEGERSLSFPY